MLWRVSFEDITSTKAFGIQCWESNLLLREKTATVMRHAVSVMKDTSVITCTDVHIMKTATVMTDTLSV